MKLSEKGKHKKTRLSKISAEREQTAIENQTVGLILQDKWTVKNPSLFYYS